MKWVIAILLLLTLEQDNAAVPDFFREKQFTAASFAEAVNHFVGLGESNALSELRNLENDISLTNHTDVPIKIGLICKVLFASETNSPLRPPEFGWLPKLGSIGLPPVFPTSRWETISNDWPLYPVARINLAYFVLSDSYAFEGFGGPESPESYIAFCEKHGVFRKTPVEVPTREEAQIEAQNLRQSRAWKSIKWKGSGEGYNFYSGGDNQAWSYIQQQADLIPIH
jgi:hypothetical protein